jgi:cob(I)alamin adenosyltransferase
MARRLYTRTGDSGKTSLADGRRVRKSHPLVRASGDLDETAAALGAALAFLPKGRLAKSLRKAQSELMGLCSGVCADPAWLEEEIDRMQAGLKPLDAFLLPGGSPAGSFLHLARTVCRRAERSVAALPAGRRKGLAYLNRFSDFLFTAARWSEER